MSISHIDETKIVTLPDGLYKNVQGQVLISPANGSEQNVLRLFHIAEGGFSANHAHDFPHYIYVLEGEGTIELNSRSSRSVPDHTPLSPTMPSISWLIPRQPGIR